MSEEQPETAPRARTETLRFDPVLTAYVAVVAVFLLVWPFKDVSFGGDHYAYLARSLLHGSLNVDSLPSSYADYVSWQGHKYLAFGPVPAVILIPFLPLFDAGVAIVWAGYALTVVNVVLFYRILGLAGVTGQRRHWATLLYFGGTTYFSITLVGISTYLAHIVATLFLLLAIGETLDKKRAILVGVFVGLAAGARLTVAFSAPFFLLMLVSRYEPVVANASDARDASGGRDARFIRAAGLLVGFAIPILVLAAYNYGRFGDFTETGFGKAELYRPELETARLAGLFSVVHIPKNLLMLLLQGPQAVGGDNAAVLHFPFIEPSKWGMGLFFTSPALLYAFRARVSDPLHKACWAAIVATLVPILMYY
ncbi:MAG TPA: hypothetical protein VIF83_09035, partial [Gemmatimonadaceae bacterium]